MSLRRLPWLIAYDVRSPQRLARIHRWLSRRAAPVQYSVFIGRFDREEIDSLRDGIRGIINESEDDVRFYPLPEEPCMTVFGQQRTPAGWSLIDAMTRPDAPSPPLGVSPRPRRPRRARQAPDPEGEKAPQRFEPQP